MVDTEGNEVNIPTCEVCGTGKTYIAGREAFVWICMGCEGVVPMEFVYNPNADRSINNRLKWISREHAKEFWPDEKKDIQTDDAYIC